MKTYKKTLIEVNKTENIVCNMCSKSIQKNDFGYFEDYVTIEKNWGYASKFDGENHSIDLCQNCYEKILNSLKIKPIENQQDDTAEKAK